MCRWKGKNIIECDNCGLLIFPTNNRQKYCKVCYDEIHKQIDKEYQRRKYNNSRPLGNL